MEVKDIVGEWLKANGYDGLVSDDRECGCVLADLAPCSGMGEHCEAAYKGPGNEEWPDFVMYASKDARDAAKRGRDESA